jgi:hypothetical protein
VREVTHGTGRIIDRPSQVGGWPTLPSGTAPTDSDRDGMPDSWEAARGFNLALDDSAGDADGDGYTNVEEYANGLVAHLTPGKLSVDASLSEPNSRARVRIAAIRFDPRGREALAGRRNREWIRLENRGGRSVDLRGWTVRDRQGHRYRFARRVLPPGGVVTLHTGWGPDVPRHRYWRRSGALWGNGGDRAALRDPTGGLVDRCGYAGVGRHRSC